MPRRAHLNPSAEALEAIKRVQPHFLTPKEELDFYAFRARSAITRRDDGNFALFSKKAGKVVLRSPTKKGADLTSTKAGRDVAEAERVFLTGQAKLLRSLTATQRGVTARARNAASLREQVLKLAQEYSSRGRSRAALIARRLGIHVKTVREIIRKANLTEWN